MRSTRLAVGTAVLAMAALGACSPSSEEVPPSRAATSAVPAPTAARPSAPTAVAFVADALEDAGFVRNEAQSDGTRVQYQDTRCVVQLLVLPGTGPLDDAEGTELALSALGEEFGERVDRPDVTVPAGGGVVTLRAQRVELDTGEGVIPMQVAIRVLRDAGATVAVTHACYDHDVADEEFDTTLALLELTGVDPADT